MKRRIRPAAEEYSDAYYTIFFVIMWYTTIIKGLLEDFDYTLIIFYLVGLLPIYKIYTVVSRAYVCRKERKYAIQYNHKFNGMIKSVQYQRLYDDERDRDSLRNYYCLNIEVYDHEINQTYMITSEPYSKPIQRYLSSPQVIVYIDESGWKYYIEDFRYKTSFRDKGLIDEEPEGFRKRKWHIIYRIVRTIILIMIFLTFLSTIF